MTKIFELLTLERQLMLRLQCLAVLTLKGTTDHTIIWTTAPTAGTFPNTSTLLVARNIEIAGTSVLTADTLGSAVIQE